MTDRQAGEMEREVTPMGEAGRTGSAGEDVSQETEQEQLRHEIEETRVELGDTVDALAQKADVKARVSEKVEQRRAAWRSRQQDVKGRMNGARESVSRATPDEAKRAAAQVGRTAEERPLPAIAVALGLGVLIGRTLGRR
jgi:ElaB/YqjD/DUF883 family membrane-anchored ribosome-binding protein